MKLFMAMVMLLALAGCSSTPNAKSKVLSTARQQDPQLIRVVWLGQPGLVALLQQKMTPLLFRSPGLKVEIGPVDDAPEWAAAYQAQNRLEMVIESLRTLGYQGQIQGRYLPDSRDGEVVLRMAYGG
ncbi:hypothetical protein SAMN04488540_10683 [Ferrimonas sediminum]|uniref:Uncharacterized protein n=1 Tax=Ferrimonas sediminum TaxID=718193 RepID=A0A1G8S7Z6_9GAMM|nr:hypothetical protein [Ferrimonas sediminum]SDJ24780.1 hypothetical protein SAMN04488540_10683 [Ferrimonas sediminum]